MATMARLAWLELKLLLREPLTVVFSLLLPLIILFVMGGVFGNEPSRPGEEVVYRGVGPMSYYVPAYLALVVASVAVMSVPAHLAGNRERGVLRRYHASSVPASAVVGAEVVVAFVLAAVSSLIMVAAAAVAYDFSAPESVPAVIGAFVFVALGFSSVGILLGAVIPTARAALAAGTVLWFVMLMVGGAGPPPEVLTGAMAAILDITPLWYAVKVMQDVWLGLDAGLAWLVFAALSVVAAGAAVRFFRWE